MPFLPHFRVISCLLDQVVTLGDEVDAFIGGDDFYLAPDFGDAGGEEIGGEQTDAKQTSNLKLTI